MMKVICYKYLPNRLKPAAPCSSKSFNVTVQRDLAKAISKPYSNRSRWNKTNAVIYKGICHFEPPFFGGMAISCLFGDCFVGKNTLLAMTSYIHYEIRNHLNASTYIPACSHYRRPSLHLTLSRHVRSHGGWRRSSRQQSIQRFTKH